jgi:PBP1b-binding outer membrane lipoprotein LpoB
MQIPKDMILSFIQQRMGGQQVAQADAQLPDQVDHEQHADLLNQLGVNPQDLLGHVSNQDGGGLASEAESLLGGALGGRAQ